VLASVTLEELGMASGPLYQRHPECMAFQLLPGGSVLAQYATVERYRILRLDF